MLPANVKAQLVLAPQGPQPLRYDQDGDGSFESTVIPTIDVSGPAAQDDEPPQVTIYATQQASLTVASVTAYDSGAGVKDIFYSVDGSEFQRYTQPVQVDRTQQPIFYAFADDNLINRSGLFTYELTAAPVDSALQVSVNSLSFGATAGGAEVNWTASSSAPWLQLSAAAGTTPASLTVNVLIAGLSAGTHSGEIAIAEAGSSSQPRIVDVSLLLAASGENSEAVLEVNGRSYSFVANVDGVAPPAQAFTITNVGRGELAWVASTSSQWLRLGSTSGTAPATIGLTVDPSGLGDGTHTAQAAIIGFAQGSPQFVDVTLTLYSPVLQASPPQFSFAAPAGGQAPTARQLVINNAGDGTLQWFASESLPWLNLSQTAGTAPSTIDVSVNPDGVAVGSYAGEIMVISSENAELMETVSVQLTITPVEALGYQLFLPSVSRP